MKRRYPKRSDRAPSHIGFELLAGMAAAGLLVALLACGDSLGASVVDAAAPDASSILIDGPDGGNGAQLDAGPALGVDKLVPGPCRIDWLRGPSITMLAATGKSQVFEYEGALLAASTESWPDSQRGTNTRRNEYRYASGRIASISSIPSVAFQFDASGRVHVREVDGAPKERTAYFYDEQGDLALLRWTSGTQTREATWTRLSPHTFERNPCFGAHCVFELDARGRLLRKEIRDDTGHVQARRELTWRDDLLVSWLDSRSDGTIEGGEILTYDPYGNLAYVDTVRKDAVELFQREVYDYACWVDGAPEAEDACGTGGDPETRDLPGPCIRKLATRKLF